MGRRDHPQAGALGFPRSPRKNAHTEYQWELYDIGSDFSEANALASQKPETLEELKDLFLVEATRY